MTHRAFTATREYENGGASDAGPAAMLLGRLILACLEPCSSVARDAREAQLHVASTARQVQQGIRPVATLGLYVSSSACCLV